MNTFLSHRPVALAAAVLFTATTAVCEADPLAANSAESDYLRTRTDLLEGVAKSWQRPENPPAGALERAAAPAALPLREKLNAISIPAVSFTNVELNRVVSALSALAEEFDTTGGKPPGVNLVLLDPANANPTVTITLRNLTLKRILDFVTDAVGFQYDVEADAVVLRPGGERFPLVTEVFAVTRSTVIRMTGQGSGPGARGNRSPEAAPDGSEHRPGVDEAGELRQFLQRAGVSFEGVAGSSMAFDGSAIIVTQTVRNLERIRTILRRYREVRQVEIEAKFMDVQEGALDELGIQWNVTRRPVPLLDPLTGAPLLNSDGSPQMRYQELYRTADPTGGTAVNRTLADTFRNSQRSSNIIIDDKTVGTLAPPTLPGANNLGQAAGNLAVITGSIGEFDVNAIVRALAQKSGTDLLSAPRVTVLSGSEALITVAQEMRYPQSFGEIQSQVGSGRTAGDGSSGAAGVAITAGTPKDFTTRNVGMELRVLPTVEEDDHSISLELHPKVTEFEGFIEYGGPSIAISGGRTVTVPPGFYQPIFSVREVSTRVTLWDGATIIMGGLTREEVKKVEDKVPILGDLPLIGRAFRSKGKSVQKRNLLIFVTAHLVNPGGAPRAPSAVARVTPPVVKPPSAGSVAAAAGRSVP
jgi:general secretion pathway protein D